MSPAADSAGQPFEGRSFQANPFASDTGEADAGAVEAIDRFHGVLGNPPSDTPVRALADAWRGVVDSLRSARLLSPLIAQAGEFGRNDRRQLVDKTQELSVVHVQGPDGRGVAPVFLDVASMKAWKPEARPIPVEAPQAALAAIADGLGLMVLNPGSTATVTLRRGALEALATGASYTPAWVDTEVATWIARGITQGMAGQATVMRHKIIPGDKSQVLAGPELIVALGLAPGLDAHQVERLVAAVSAEWAASELLNRRVDGLGVKVLPV